MTLLVKDSAGITKTMQTTESPFEIFNPVHVSRDFYLEVAMGKIPGYSMLEKFGANPLVTPATDPEDVWEGGGLYNFSSTADIVSLSSSNAADTNIIGIYGLLLDGTDTYQEIQLNGQSVIALTSPLWRVYRMINMSSVNIQGQVYCYSGATATAGVPSGGSITKAKINDGNNQTLMAIYTIPKGKVGFLLEGETGIKLDSGPQSSTEYLTIHYKTRLYQRSFSLKKEITILTTGSSTYKDAKKFPDVLPALTDVRVESNEVSVDMGVWASFSMLLVDESELSSAFLTSIKQPGY